MQARQHGKSPRIVVGVDGSASADEALRWAVRQAELSGGTVAALLAWQYPVAVTGLGLAPIVMYDDSSFHERAEKVLAEAIARAVDPASDVPVHPRAVFGPPAQVLLDAAGDADLLVVGSRGHGGFAGTLLGSVSQNCVHHARCPVVVIRGRHDRGVRGAG
jgi:nucleotide-binding universal stress UspA family protein